MARGRGRPAATIDLKELEKLCALQCTDEEIAAWFGVTTKTIQRRKADPAFAEHMELGRAKGRVSLRRALFEAAGKGVPGPAIFLAKNLLGYRDRLELAGDKDNPLKVDTELTVRFVAAEQKPSHE